MNAGDAVSVRLASGACFGVVERLTPFRVEVRVAGVRVLCVEALGELFPAAPYDADRGRDGGEKKGREGDRGSKAAGVTRHRAALVAMELGAVQLEEHPERLQPARVEPPAPRAAAPARPRRPSRTGARAPAPAAARDAVLARLAAFLAARGIGLKAAARAAKVSPSVLCEWRAGTRENITGEVLARVSAWIDREEQTR